MIEWQAEISTKDGRMNTFICHPERCGLHPVILFFMGRAGYLRGTAGYGAPAVDINNFRPLFFSIGTSPVHQRCCA
jgi:hypothetical protein